MTKRSWIRSRMRISLSKKFMTSSKESWMHQSWRRIRIKKSSNLRMKSNILVVRWRNWGCVPEKRKRSIRNLTSQLWVCKRDAGIWMRSFDSSKLRGISKKMKMRSQNRFCLKWKSNTRLTFTRRRSSNCSRSLTSLLKLMRLRRLKRQFRLWRRSTRICKDRINNLTMILEGIMHMVGKGC